MANPLSRTLQLYKDAYSGHPREVWALAFLTFLNRMGTLVLPFLSVYLTTQLHFSLKEAGILAMAFGLGSFSGSWLGGKLTQWIGANKVIMLSLFSSGVLLICLQFVDSFAGFFILMYITATCGESYRPAMTVASAEVVSKSQMGRTTSLLRLAINLGMAAGPSIGGFIAVTWSYGWLFWIDGVTCMISAVFFFVISLRWSRQVKNKSKEEEAESKETEAKEEEEGPPPYKNGKYLIFLLSTFLLGFVFIQFIHTLPVFIKGEWGFDERYLGILFGFSCALVVLIEMPLVQWFETNKKIRYAMWAGVLLIGVSYLVYLFPPGMWLCFLGTFLWTMGEILVLPFNNSVAINLSPTSKRGDYMSWYWMTWSLCSITGPLIGFAVADQWGFEVLWIGVLGLAIISFVILRLLGNKVVE